jgi:MYXO-CTERM domain-containing protein
MKHKMTSLVAGLVAVGGVVFTAQPARACGGFFCNAVQPVNQAAERIIFADNGDGTQTAVIEIMYQGPSQNFSWLLPISSVPTGDQIKVASDIAFQRLQSATNPRYTLTTRVEGTCKQDVTVGTTGTGGTSGGPISATGGTGGSMSQDGGGVTVEASGVVGAFAWTAISLDASLANPADVAVKWLTDNGYDVPSGAADLLGPYLADGLYLLALKLTKGADTGSIRPVVLTYKGDHSSIPIKLTAVSANANMGVMTWLLGDNRGIPENYLSLELNEARINWFNASSNYNDVVIAAAADAGGQGFVTELSGPTTSLANVVWTQSDDALWKNFQNTVYTSFDQLFQSAYSYYGTYDGFWDAVKQAVTLPSSVSFDSFKLCPTCYSSQITLDPSTFVQALDDLVIEPIHLVQTLIDSHPEVTRLYTTMSAEDMTVDPLFGFNPDLPAVSNVHTAERVIECSADIYQYQAPWRIELPQGGVVRGTASDVGTWPADFSNQPPNRVISRVGESGMGKTVEDNTTAINDALDAYNNTVPSPTPSAGSGGSGGGSGGTSAKGGSGGKGGSSGKGGSGATGGTTGGSTSGGADNQAGAGEPETSGSAGMPARKPKAPSSGGGCTIAGENASTTPLLAMMGLGLVLARRRRRG